MTLKEAIVKYLNQYYMDQLSAQKAANDIVAMLGEIDVGKAEVVYTDD